MHIKILVAHTNTPDIRDDDCLERVELKLHECRIQLIVHQRMPASGAKGVTRPFHIAIGCNFLYHLICSLISSGLIRSPSTWLMPTTSGRGDMDCATRSTSRR